MAKRGNGKRAKKKTKKSADLDLIIISLIILSILLAVLIYTNAGKVGTFLSPLLGGLVGSIKYVIPVG